MPNETTIHAAAADHAPPQPRDWSAFVLLLIDAQHDFWPAPMATRFPAFPDNVARLLAFCRAERLDVVHVRASFQPDGSDWMPAYRVRRRIPCVAGTPGVEVLAFAVEVDGEPVITKQSFDGFRGTGLDAQLRAAGKRYVLTAGLVTSVCVLLTTASAAQRGFLTAVVEDCCADRPEVHERTLDWYGRFLFSRTPLESLPTAHAAMTADLEKLAASAAPPGRSM
jgi:nicotinamidase-related amidase